MVNDDGTIYVSETEPLTTQLIAKSLHRRQPFIENGLRALEQVDLIERDETGVIRILIWDELQSFHRDERRREQTHERVRRYRERQRLAQEKEAQQEGLPEERPISETSGETLTDFRPRFHRVLSRESSCLAHRCARRRICRSRKGG